MRFVPWWWARKGLWSGYSSSASQQARLLSVPFSAVRLHPLCACTHNAFCMQNANGAKSPRSTTFGFSQNSRRSDFRKTRCAGTPDFLEARMRTSSSQASSLNNSLSNASLPANVSSLNRSLNNYGTESLRWSSLGGEGGGARSLSGSMNSATLQGASGVGGAFSLEDEVRRLRHRVSELEAENRSAFPCLLLSRCLQLPALALFLFRLPPLSLQPPPTFVNPPLCTPKHDGDARRISCWRWSPWRSSNIAHARMLDAVICVLRTWQ